MQPARGLIVDDMGRPLVANRTSWVVTVDRTLLGKLDDEVQKRLLRRIAGAVDRPYATIRDRTLLCGEPGSMAGTCWNGSPYQPVPIAKDIEQQTAISIMEQNEDFPAVLVENQTVRSYPAPYGINAAHLLGYLSPITEGELDRAEKDEDESVHGASVVGRAGLEKAYDRYLRGFPGYKQVAVDSVGRVLGDSGEVQGRVGDTLVTSIDARVQAVVEQQLAQTIKTARATVDEVTGRPYVADSGAAVVMEADTGRIVAMASQPTYDPKLWVGGISESELQRLYSDASGTPLLSRATQGQFAPGSTWKPFMTAGALRRRLLARAPQLDLLLVAARRQPRLQELRVRRLRLHRLPEGPRGLLQHLLLPDRAELLAEVRLRRRRRRRQGPAGRGGQGVRLRLDHRHRHPG